ncbi:MAG: PAS domain S-box protein [Methanoregulaceae archaeon]|nr:MAG: PAS domain S-box protein [Methanoregulaceae archaeon]
MKSVTSPHSPQKKNTTVPEPDREEASRQSEAQLNAIIRASPVPMFVIDNSHRVISWNYALENSTGIDARTVLGTNLHWKAFYPSERPCLADVLLDGALEKIPELYADKWKKSEILEGAIEASDFFPHLGTGGKWFHFIAAPITDGSGAPIGAMETLEDITGLVREQQELHESEERYSALFSNNYSVSLLIDPDTGRIVEANEAAVRYYGYSHNQLTTMGIYDLNRLPNDTVVRNIRRAKDEKEKHFFSTHYRADGEKRYVEIYSGPIRVQGKLLFYSIIHDITDRKKAEAALRESEERFFQVSESAGVWIWEIDENGLYTYASPVVEKILGYAPEDLVGKKYFFDLFAPEAREDLRRASLAAFGRRETFRNFINPTIHKNGSRVILDTSGAPIVDEYGRLTGYRGTDTDITARERAEEELRESEERYRTLVDQLPDYVIVHRDGILLYVNPASAARMGYDGRALQGRSILEFIAPEYHKTVRNAIARRMAGKDVASYEMKIRAKDGTFRTVLNHGSTVMFEGRLASLNVLSDITDRKLMEEEVRSLNRVLEQRVKDRTEALSRTNEQLTAEIAARTHAEQEIVQSLREKDLLLREIHHRVKNNLQIIASLLNLQSRTINDPNVLEAIRNSQSRIRAMALVHERIYRSHSIAEINLKDYLNYLIKQIFQFCNIQQHQIRMEVTMDEIMADIDTITPLGLIINELVSNSLKHAFPKGRQGAISIECSPQDAGMLRIVYHDNGIGIPAGYDWKKTESLGLRLVNSLVDQLNGTIESGGGEGTTFILTIQQKQDPSSS